MRQRQVYFSARDLLMMAVLAALDGVVSPYVNAIGDFLNLFLVYRRLPSTKSCAVWQRLSASS